MERSRINTDGPTTGSSKRQSKFAIHHPQSRLSSSNIHGDAAGSRHQILRRTKSSGGDSLTSIRLEGHVSPSRNWVPGQEYSHIQAYDPYEEILHAHKYASERKDLHFRQIFRYSKCLDWFLMIIGLILAVFGSLITPWLYYWGGVTLHDILVFERCNATSHNISGKVVCDIPGYCGTTLADVGRNLFFNILWGWIAYNVIQLSFCICFTISADRQTKAMRAAYFESIVRKDMAWFDLFADKDFAKEMTEQITHIRLGIGDVIPNFINLVCTVVAMIVIVFLLSHTVALAFLVFIPISMLMVYVGNWSESKRAIVADNMFEKANTIAKESLVNIKVIKMYEAEKRQTHKFAEMLDDKTEDGKKEKKKEIQWTIIAAASSGSIWLLLNIATSLVFWFGQGSHTTTELFCKKQTNWGILSVHGFTTLLLGGGLDLGHSPGEILLVYFGLMYITLHAMEVPNFVSLIDIAVKNATGVFFIIDWKSRIDNTSNEGKMPKRNAVGRLDFNLVTFRYPQKPEETVLSIRQLTIYSGQYVAFQGPSDSGKNTILKLIPRLYDCCSGFIALDAVNLQNYNIHWLRRQMCIISEFPVIFSGTISENILFGKLDASEEEIIKACQLAELHHVIEKLPHGYNTKISSKEFGDHLTRNEKRQLCLARAYLHRSRLILMDNPVQPEDDILEPLLLKFVHHFRDTATVILASSNVTALSKRADCIYYMENGRILESGTHIQLIQARGKYYNRLEDTMNCSVETRNKFESQLKAYKYSQLLHKKRKSSMGNTLGDNSWEETDGEEPRRRKKVSTFWNTLFKVSGRRKQSTKEADLSAGAGEGTDGKLPNETGKRGSRRSILRQSRPRSEVVEISTLEETYNRYHSGRKRSTGGGTYMHNGFGIMGFQRMNFARPMTNYSTQIHKQRHAFSSIFQNTGSQSLNNLRARKLSFHPGAVDNVDPTVSEINETRRSGVAGTHVRFSMLDAGNRNRGHGVQPTHGPGAKGAGKSKPHKTPTRKSFKDSIKYGLFAFDRKSRTSKSNLALDDPKLQKIKSKQNHVTSRDSVQDALNTMIHPGSFHINERVEIDNISILSQDLDSFLAEYDESVSSTLNSEVKGFWRDIFFVVKHDWWFIIPALIASVILGLSIPYQTWIVGTFFQALASRHCMMDDKDDEITWLIVYILITGVITGVAAFTQEFFLAMAGKRMTRRLREKLFAHILKQDLAWFDDKAHDIGILTFHLYADTMIIHHILLMSYGIAVQALCSVAISVAFAATETRQETLPVTICFIVGMPFFILIVYLSSKKELSESEHVEDRFRTASTFAGEFIVNIKTWFSLGAEPFFISQHKKILDTEYRFIKLSSIFITCVHSIVQTSSWLLYGIFILLTLKYYKQANGQSDLFRVQEQYPTPFEEPTLIGFVMITTELLIFGAYRTGDSIAILTDAEFGKAAAHKIMRILVNEPETDLPSKINVPSEETLEEDFYEPPPEIGLTNITYYYPNTDQSQQEGHLKGISMTIGSCSYVAIVGPPGSGKSTLCNILLRMCNPTVGILDFNGDDSFNLSPKVSRRLMGLVEYDPCLFNCSLLENIRFGKCYTHESDVAHQLEVEEAAKLCNCHYEILDLPEDYCTSVDAMERTSQNFSLKQRVSYSRALLRKPKILLVDDATSSVDTDSDHKIMEVLANVREGRTLIVFSHKIEPVRDADTIFVLWEGEIVESGTDSFLINKKGYYYEMYMTQKVLADSMRNSPNQLNTIRYNIKKQSHKHPSGEALSPGESKNKLAEMAAVAHPAAPRNSTVTFFKFLDDRVKKLKAEKAQRRKELERELPKLEMEEKERELKKSGKRESAEKHKK